MIETAAMYTNSCILIDRMATLVLVLRSESWGREAQRRINEDVQTFLRDEVACGQASLVALISWIQVK